MISRRDFRTLHVLVLLCCAPRIAAVRKPSVCRTSDLVRRRRLWSKYVVITPLPSRSACAHVARWPVIVGSRPSLALVVDGEPEDFGQLFLDFGVVENAGGALHGPFDLFGDEEPGAAESGGCGDVGVNLLSCGLQLEDVLEAFIPIARVGRGLVSRLVDFDEAGDVFEEAFVVGLERAGPVRPSGSPPGSSPGRRRRSARVRR